MARFASSSVCWSRPVMTTRAPCSLNSFAVARPMPELPPVIMATLPSNLPILFLFLSCFAFCSTLARRSLRRVLGQTFQNGAKNLVEYRQRHLHHIFQRLAILCGLGHQHQTLKTAVEKSRHRTRIANSWEVSLLLSAQQRAIENVFQRVHIAASPGRGLLATAG